LGPCQQEEHRNRPSRQQQAATPSKGPRHGQHRPEQHRQVKTRGGQSVGEAGDPKGLPQVLGQGHHRAAEHQGRQQPASFGAGAGQKPFRDSPPQVGDGGGWAGDHLQRLHPETGPGALAGETFRGPRQQGMGSRPGAPQQALHLQTPPLPQLVAGGQPQLGAPPSQLKERLAGAIGVTLGIGRQGALQHHECAGPFALQSPHGLMGAWLGGALAGPEHQGQGEGEGDQPGRLSRRAFCCLAVALDARGWVCGAFTEGGRLVRGNQRGRVLVVVEATTGRCAKASHTGAGVSRARQARAGGFRRHHRHQHASGGSNDQHLRKGSPAATDNL